MFSELFAAFIPEAHAEEQQPVKEEEKENKEEGEREAKEEAPEEEEEPEDVRSVLLG